MLRTVAVFPCSGKDISVDLDLLDQEEEQALVAVGSPDGHVDEISDLCGGSFG